MTQNPIAGDRKTTRITNGWSIWLDSRESCYCEYIFAINKPPIPPSLATEDAL